MVFTNIETPSHQVRRQRILATKITFINEIADLERWAPTRSAVRGIDPDGRIASSIRLRAVVLPLGTLWLWVRRRARSTRRKEHRRAVIQVNSSAKKMARKVIDFFGRSPDSRSVCSVHLQGQHDMRDVV